MASTLHATGCAAAALLYWTFLGFPLAQRLIAPSLAMSLAPMTGWAVHSAVASPIFLLVPFSAVTVAIVAAAAIPLAFLAARYGGNSEPYLQQLRVPRWAFFAAAALAAVSAAAIVPKHIGDSIALSAPIFDHAKVAIVDEIARLGMPPGNPFFGDDGGAGRLVYYYLLHFSAAELSLLLGVSGWEADIAMTWFAAFASLALMMGLAVQLSRRASAAVWTIVLATTASGRVWLWWLFRSSLDGVLLSPAGFAGWLFQSAWAPQHIASAACVLLSIYVISQFSDRTDALRIAMLAIAGAAGFGSSTWVGGVAFTITAIALLPFLLHRAGAGRRLKVVSALAVSGLLALCLAAPLLQDQIPAAALHGGGSPVIVHPYEVLGARIPEQIRRALDLPAFWLVLLPIEIPAIYVTGSFVLVQHLRKRGPDGKTTTLALAVMTVACLATAWLLTSTLGDNNDLGWRALLPAAMVLTLFAATGLASWTADRAHLASALAIGAVALGIPGTVLQFRGNFAPTASPESAVFAWTPAMWEGVRLHAATGERVGNNPLAFATMTPWPVNISWSLLANRRSCFAGRELALVYTSLRRPRLEAIESQFVRVFAGDATKQDIEDLVANYDCSVIVLTSQDGAWNRDPFGASPLYRLVEENAGRWKIYRATAARFTRQRATAPFLDATDDGMR